jgi:uncharacterized phage protein (TIGR01671 family)
MEREIKFRVWHKGEMFLTNAIMNASARYYIRDAQGISPHADVYYEQADAPIMQFTGLLDKNGKEIYEGDIIKYFQPYSNKWDTHIVLWDEKFAGFGMFEYNNEWCKESDWLKIKEIEIIGNIYENPELIIQ